MHYQAAQFESVKKYYDKLDSSIPKEVVFFFQALGEAGFVSRYFFEQLEHDLGSDYFRELCRKWFKPNLPRSFRVAKFVPSTRSQKQS